MEEACPCGAGASAGAEKRPEVDLDLPAEERLGAGDDRRSGRGAVARAGRARIWHGRWCAWRREGAAPLGCAGAVEHGSADWGRLAPVEGANGTRGGGGAGSARSSMPGGPGGALPAAGGARMPLVGAGRLWPRLDAGCRTRSGSAVPSSRRIAGGPAQWWRARCAGVHVQWRYGLTLACCVGVAGLGESLPGDGRPAATASVGVARNLHSLYSRIMFLG